VAAALPANTTGATDAIKVKIEPEELVLDWSSVNVIAGAKHPALGYAVVPRTKR
jgi:hypothetical protein